MTSSPYFAAKVQKLDSHIADSLTSTSEKHKKEDNKRDSSSFSLPCSMYCPAHLKYVRVEARRESFEPNYKYLKNPSISELARSGFFFDNVLHKVICYSCGKGLFHEYYDDEKGRFQCVETTNHYVTDDCPRAPTNLHEKYEYLKYVPESALK